MAHNNDSRATNERLEQLTNAINLLVTNLTPNQAQNQNQNFRTPREQEYPLEDRNLKLDIPSFDGSMDPEVYLEWERSMEEYFDYKETPEPSKFKIAKLKLVQHAAFWLQEVQNKRIHQQKAKIETWDKLKRHLRLKFVPSNYKQQMYFKWTNLQQGSKNVAEFTREFEQLSIACGINEQEDIKLAKYVSSLNMDIKEQLETRPYIGFDEACSLALVFERQRKKKPSSIASSPFSKTPYTSRYPNKGYKDGATSSTRPTPSRDIQVNKTREALKPMKDITCFKCQGIGHYQRGCPNARVFTSKEWEDIIKWLQRKMKLVQNYGDQEPTL